MNMNDLLGNMGLGGLTGATNVFHGPWNSNAAGDAFRQQEGLAAVWRLAPVGVPSPEECKQSEIERKNRINYARWLARMQREPLQDVTFR